MLEPLYRWAGGKNKVLKYIIPHLVKKNTYIEPFFGGGAVFCEVFNNNLVDNYIINDIKFEIMNLYKDIRDNYTSFINEVKYLESEYLNLTKENRKIYYYNKRKYYWNNQHSSLLYFLMKTSFNGIWQTCRLSNGLFATPCGLLNEKTNFINEKLLKEWSIALQKVTILTNDFEKINNFENSLVYCDPPYRDVFTKYSEIFNDNDQFRCLEWCKNNINKNNKILLSNKSDGIFFENNINNKFPIYSFNIKHTAGRKKQNVIETGIKYTSVDAQEILIIFE